MKQNYSGLIKQLHKRSGLTVAAYADALGLSRKLMSDIINDQVRATHKTLEAALDQAGMGAEELLIPNANQASAGNLERTLVQAFRLLSDEGQALALKVCQTVYLSERNATVKRRNRKGSRSGP